MNAPICPRCPGSSLTGQNVAQTRLASCATCGGVWLEPAAFREVLTQPRRQDDLLRAFGPPRPLEPEANIVDLKCPSCQAAMLRTNFAKCSAVIIDVCRHHGIWFDAGELPAVAAFVRQGGMDTSRAQEAEKAQWRAEEKVRRADHERTLDVMLLQRGAANPLLTGEWSSGSLATDALIDVVTSFLDDI